MSKKQTTEDADTDLLKKEIDTLKKELLIKDEQCKIIEQLKIEHQAVIDDLTQHKNKFKDYQKKTEDCKKKYDNEIEKYRKTTEELINRWNNEYKDKCISTMNRNAFLETENKRLQKELTDFKKKIITIEKEREKENESNQHDQNKKNEEISLLKKKNFELTLENKKFKNSFSENQEDLDILNQKNFEALNIENQNLKIEIDSVKKENEQLKKQLDAFQQNPDDYSKPPEIDENFSIQRVEADSRLIKYYNNREKRLQMIEAALRKNSDEARKLYIIEQIQEKFIQDDIKEKLKNQEEKIETLNELNKCYEDINKKIEDINEKNKVDQSNPLIQELEQITKENYSLKEMLENQKNAYSKFTKAAFKAFSIYKSGLEEIYNMIQNYQSSYKTLIDEVDDVALRINLHHPIISFYKKMSSFVLFSPNENNNNT